MKLFHLLMICSVTASMTMGGCKKDGPDLCEGVACLNGGTCSNGSCSCAPGYEDVLCFAESRAKFVGLYNGTISCTGFNQAWNLTITSSSAGISSVVISDGTDNFIGTVDGSSIYIATQTVGSGITISGSGQLSGLILSLNINVSGSTCTYTGTKQ